MDLNQLYFDHQLLLMEPRAPLWSDARRAQLADASLIAGRIGCIQRGLGASAAPAWEALARFDADPFAPPTLDSRGYAS